MLLRVSVVVITPVRFPFQLPAATFAVEHFVIQQLKCGYVRVKSDAFFQCLRYVKGDDKGKALNLSLRSLQGFCLSFTMSFVRRQPLA